MTDATEEEGNNPWNRLRRRKVGHRAQAGDYSRQQNREFTRFRAGR